MSVTIFIYLGAPIFQNWRSLNTPGECEGQGSLECCSPWGHKESDTTE